MGEIDKKEKDRQTDKQTEVQVKKGMENCPKKCPNHTYMEVCYSWAARAGWKSQPARALEGHSRPRARSRPRSGHRGR